ncbi:MAG: hypothetical protein EAY75_15690, partial [Bacteroidetes bacterium]
MGLLVLTTKRPQTAKNQSCQGFGARRWRWRGVVLHTLKCRIVAPFIYRRVAYPSSYYLSTMPLTSSLEIYKASAGSGKTFLLTIKYLSLLLRATANYRRILAVTFTNKATAEMKHRILHELKQMAVGKHTACVPLLLENGVAENEAALQVLCKTVYSSLLHDYSRFSVSTIDTFVQRIVRAFAWEIGIEGNFNLQLQTDVVKEDLAKRLFARLQTDKDLLDWVVELAEQRLSDGKGWDFNADMLDLASELFKERFQDFEAALGQQTPAEIHANFVNLRQTVYNQTRQYEQQWQQLGKKAVALYSASGLAPEDFHFGKAGFINYFSKAEKGQIEPPGARVMAALEPNSKWAPKTANAHTVAAIDAVAADLRQMLQQLVNWADELSAYSTALLIKKNLGMLRLMRVFAEELKHYRAENNTLLISDTHLLLRQLTADANAAFIYEKTGNRFQHYLIDEFQDTSGFQWQNFKPLLENALGEGHYNLIVGDVKQAIYRWRNGDWRLLMRGVKQDLGQLDVREFSLQQNWRSAAPIIDFNNFLFCAAPSVLQNMLTAELNGNSVHQGADLLAEGYGTVFAEAYADALQTVPDGASSLGYVGLKWVEEKSDEDGDYKTAVLADLHQQILALLAEGFLPSDLGILTRTNGEARAVVEYLMAAETPATVSFTVVSGEALLLRSSMAIQLLVAAIAVLSNPKNTVAWAQLRYLYLLLQNMEVQRVEVFASNGTNSGLPQGFVQEPDALRRLPMNELVNQLIMLFQLDAEPAHGPYLLAFQDDLLQWMQKGEAGLAAFLHYWETESERKALPTKADAHSIEVITVHQSKGLAYTVVLMPFINWSIKPTSTNQPLVWVNTAHTPYHQVGLLPVRYGSKMSGSLFSAAFVEEQVLCMMDNLNVLYVAFTRARTRIYGWMPTKKKAETKAPAHMGDLLWQVAGGQGYSLPQSLPDVRHRFDAEALSWQYGIETPPASKTSEVAAEAFPALVFSSWRQKLRLRHPQLTTSAEAASALELPRQRGVLLHQVLQGLQQPQDLPMVLHQMATNGLLSLHEKALLEQPLATMLAHALFEPWASGQMQRLSERAIVTESRSISRPDLVLYNSHET